MRIPCSSTTSRRGFAAAAALVTAALTLSARPAEAQANETTFYACYVPGSGTVYRIKSASTPAACKKSTHVEFQWTDFLRAIDPFITKQLSIAVNPGAVSSAEAECPAGSVAYAGGFVLDDDGLRVLGSHPHSGDTQSWLRKWVVRVKNESSAVATFSVYARCASI
jgi:hypothetical protein